MKHALVAYGVVLVVLLMLARQFEAAGWTGIEALDVATALADALLVLAAAAAALLAGRLGLDSWARSMERWRAERAWSAVEAPDAEVIGVTSWRPGARALPVVPPVAPPQQQPSTAAPEPLPQTAAAGFTYVGPSYARESPAAPPFPERRGRRI